MINKDLYMKAANTLNKVDGMQDMVKYKLKEKVLSGDISISDYESIVGDSVDITLDELKASKKREIKTKCKEVIENGFRSKVKDGINEEHYSLRLEDQTNMTVLMSDIQLGIQSVPWHNSSQSICEMWDAATFASLYMESKIYILMQRFYSDGLEEMINRATTMEDLNDIYWGATLPEDIQSTIDQMISSSMGQVGI